MKYIFSAALLISIMINGISSAEELTGQEIIKRMDDLMRGDTLRGKYVMTVTTPGWTRRLELDAWNTGRDRTFIRILSPEKEVGTGTLRVKESMWNYLPSVEKIIKIPPSMMLQPWMGSDFANDDLVKESSIVYDYTHNIAGEEDIGGSMAYRIELIPKPGAAVTWGKLIFLIRKEDLLPVREEYYSDRGKLINVLEYSEIKQMSDRKIPALWRMASQVKEGHYTTIEVVDAVYNQPISEGIFTLENLRRTR